MLAVDICSGLDGLTGVAAGLPYEADATVTFAALKPGLLFADGQRCSGGVTVADIGLDIEHVVDRLFAQVAIDDHHALARHRRNPCKTHGNSGLALIGKR